MINAWFIASLTICYRRQQIRERRAEDKNNRKEEKKGRAFLFPSHSSFSQSSFLSYFFLYRVKCQDDWKRLIKKDLEVVVAYFNVPYKHFLGGLKEKIGTVKLGGLSSRLELQTSRRAKRSSDHYSAIYCPLVTEQVKATRKAF
jgi:hypothetical protein